MQDDLEGHHEGRDELIIQLNSLSAQQMAPHLLVLRKQGYQEEEDVHNLVQNEASEHIVGLLVVASWLFEGLEASQRLQSLIEGGLERHLVGLSKFCK